MPVPLPPPEDPLPASAILEVHELLIAPALSVKVTLGEKFPPAVNVCASSVVTWAVPMPVVTSCTVPSPKLKVAFWMVPSGSFPVAVKVSATGADPEAVVDVRVAQAGERFAIGVGVGADAVGVGAAGGGVTGIEGLGVAAPPQVAAVIAICNGLDPAALNTFSPSPSASERTSVPAVSIAIWVGEPFVGASGFMTRVPTVEVVVTAFVTSAPTVNVALRLPLAISGPLKTCGKV